MLRLYDLLPRAVRAAQQRIRHLLLCDELHPHRDMRGHEPRERAHHLQTTEGHPGALTLLPEKRQCTQDDN